jgi:hypothetical protein
MVTITIPSIKVTIPMTAVMEKAPTSTPDSPAITQLPPAVNVIHADVKASSPASTSSSAKSENSVHSAIHVQKEEAISTPPPKVEELPIPDLPPEPKPMSKASGIKTEGERSPKLSLLPPDPPPDLPAHRTSSANPSRKSLDELPPPPPPIPRSTGSSSQGGPQVDSEKE